MRCRPLGRTGIAVSEIAFGCVEIGIPYGIGVRGEADLLSETDAVALLRAAVDRGITFFDTAPAYGRSEKLLGLAFEGARDRVVLCTKCPKLADAEGHLLPPTALAEAVESTLVRSLHDLRTDHVDVLLLHQVTDEILASDALRGTLAAMRRRGLARAIGASTYSLEHTRRVIESGDWDVVQVAYNLLDQRHATLFGLAQDRGVGVMVRSVLFKGVLTDRGAGLHPALAAVSRHRGRYQALLGPYATALSELATKFVLASPEVSSVLVGIDRMPYLEQAVAVATGPALPPDVVAKARSLAYPDPEFLDLPTWDRKGWLR